jgi:hypothetical protein
MLEPEFEPFLFGGADDVATVDTGPARIERRSLGFVDLPDGKLFACDPLVPLDQEPLSHRLDPGSYEVVLFVAVALERDGTAPHRERNVAAALVCSQTEPVAWQPASRDGGQADATAYGVDSGTGCFMGSRASKAIFESDEAVGNEIIAALEQTSGALVTVHGAAAVAVFRSGIGDGAYHTWWGRDANGSPALILTDFGGLASRSHVAAVRDEWAARAAKKWWEFWK